MGCLPYFTTGAGLQVLRRNGGFRDTLRVQTKLHCTRRARSRWEWLKNHLFMVIWGMVYYCFAHINGNHIRFA